MLTLKARNKVPSEFVHLRAHTEYSVRKGLLRMGDFIDYINAQGMSAVAISDHSNLCGTVKFYKRAVGADVKPIIAADLMIKEDDGEFLATFYCQNEKGYQNLTWLISQAYLKGQDDHGNPHVHWEWLEDKVEGLIALSGGHQGAIGQALLMDKHSIAVSRLQRWKALFPDRFYLEISRAQRPQEEVYLHAAVALAAQLDVPVVATNDVYFLDQGDFEAHEARVCIHDSNVLEDANRPHLYTEQQYLKSTAEMLELFSDIPEAIENTVEIAKRCSCPLRFGETFLPQFPVPEGFTTASFLAHEAQDGLNKMIAHLTLTPEQRAVYDDRLKHELSVIEEMGFPGYFLIVADFIGWAKNNKIPVGPGRGSGAGSLVAYALNITTLDPIEHELLFERFLNPERVSMPDFDIDFCMEQRDRVIDYVADRYGRFAVSQIITYGTMAAKAVLRDVGRVLGMPYGFCDKLAKLIPFEIGMTLDKAMEQEERLAERYRDEEEVATLIDLAKKLEGITRNVGKHAGGVVIAPGQLTDFTPLYCEPGGGNLVTQFDKDDVEGVGLVKFDFLGLRTLTIIDWSVQAINKKRAQNGEEPIDIERIPTDDKQTFELLQRCETTAVFQLESRGMKELVKRLKPDSFDEITALVALFRPGPLQSGMVDDYIDRKHGRAVVNYPHPDIADILQPTYGVILYQEQVMQIAQVLACYSLGAADLLRRAMGKKKPEEMAKQRIIFIEGAEKRGIDKEVSEYIFDLMEKFAGYGFNKSHSAAYALIAYQTAWLKSHYPAEFMASVLSSDMDNTDKVVGFIKECERMKLTVRPPSINEGEYQFTVNPDGEIIYGLGAIKGVGQAAVLHIVAQRNDRGAFNHLFDFCQRVDLHVISRRVLEPLAKSGAFDAFDKGRATIFSSINRGIQMADQASQAAKLGQDDLFGGAADETANIEYVATEPWLEREKLQFEKDTLGHYISGHPFNTYQHELANVVSCSIQSLTQRHRKEAKISGILIAQRVILTKKGKHMAVVKLEDQSAAIEVTVFPKLFEAARDLLQNDTVLIVSGKVEDDTFTGGKRIVADTLESLDAYRQQRAKCLVLNVDSEVQVAQLLEGLPRVVADYRGGNCPLVVHYQSKGAKAQLVLGDEWKVRPQEALLQELERVCGKSAVQVSYA